MADKQSGRTVYTALIMPLSSHATFPKPQPPTQPGQPQPPTGGQPPHPDHTLPGDLPHPEHPIYYPLPPDAPVDPGYGIPEDGPHPDHTLPGGQGGVPTHPIVLPPDAQGGWGPIYIWGGGPGARPPIAIPPEGQQPEGKITWKAVWSPSNGWQTIGVVVPGVPVPTPSKK